jgi:hypothetical protein
MVTESVTGDETVTPVVTTLVRGEVGTAVVTVVGTGEAAAEAVVVALALAVTVVIELAVEIEVDPETMSPVEVSVAPARVVDPSGPVTS